MMKSKILEHMAKALELPNSAYETAISRYEDLGSWLESSESTCVTYSPYVFSQGSFRLGTAIRPLTNTEEYDLDLACLLKENATKQSHSQADLKAMMRKNLEAYRKRRGIKLPVESKHRCLRLEYQDDLSFHMDIVPCIPEDSQQRILLMEAMMQHGETNTLSSQAAQSAVAITDDRHPHYHQKCRDWLISNPEGFAQWVESKMRLGDSFLARRIEETMVERIEDLPRFRWKSPLQRCIQMLKRHRDLMFRRHQDSKPISIIITTLASRAYRGESELGAAMDTILQGMESHISLSTPRIQNPVNPKEDFADRWSMPQYRHLQLEHNFRVWMKAAKADFTLLMDNTNVSFLVEQASQKFSLSLNESALAAALGAVASPTSSPKHHDIGESPKPWSRVEIN